MIRSLLVVDMDTEPAVSARFFAVVCDGSGCAATAPRDQDQAEGDVAPAGWRYGLRGRLRVHLCPACAARSVEAAA
jgi:hypothetical protein